MPACDKPTVVARNVTKMFLVGRKGDERSLLQRRNRIEVPAVKNVSFVAYAGESIGILGRNGSGKSTLLNMIAGNEIPTSGTVLVSARPTLLGVSAALQSHLNAYANVKLGLLSMGLTPGEADAMNTDVIEWAELGEAATRPIRTYSSGMKARLKFAIATAVRREILLVDEALSTGDSTFADKAHQRMNEFLEAAGTVFIVSHSASQIEKYCSRVIWIHDGAIIADGRTKPVIKSYRLWSKRTAIDYEEGAQHVINNMKKRYPRNEILLDSEAATLLDEVSHPHRR